MFITYCECCGKIIEHKYESSTKKFCSRSCLGKGTKKPGKKVTVTCQWCKKDFELLESAKRKREKRGDIVKYCSQKCSGLAQRKVKQVNSCKNCGNDTKTKWTTFCSNECVREYRDKNGYPKKTGYWYENGYKVIYLEGDKSIKEHIKVMEDHIGRKLRPDEVVHHINEIKTDNRIENLQLMTRGEHSAYHRKKDIEDGKNLFGK